MQRLGGALEREALSDDRPDEPGVREPLVPSSVTYGAELTFETVVPGDAPVRLRAHEDTLLRVIAGFVSVTVAGDERMLAAGEEAIVPAGVPHHVAGARGGARFVVGFRLAR